VQTSRTFCLETRSLRRNEITAEVMARISSVLRGGDYLEAWLVYTLGPVLFSSKPGAVLSLCRGCGPVGLWLAEGEKRVKKLGLEFRTLRKCGDGVCVYFYDRLKTEKWFEREDNASLLSEFGYSGKNLDADIDRLVGLYATGCPDEIGIFLGIPAEEVRAFSALRRPPIKLIGYWQVFVDPEKSLRKFAEYDSAALYAGRKILKACEVF